MVKFRINFISLQYEIYHLFKFFSGSKNLELSNPIVLASSRNNDVLSNYIIEMLSEIKEIKIDIKGIRQDLNIIKTSKIHGGKRQITVTSTVQLEELYNMKIPFLAVEDFKMFDDNLGTNSNLRQDVVRYLYF